MRLPRTVPITNAATTFRSIRSVLAPRFTCVADTQNNQRLGVHWADDFEFDAKLSRYGAIAQLGERRDGIAKVAGSSPAGSTLFSP
jgi:hypothetical protein